MSETQASKSKVPTWANVVGIFGLCFGVMGVLGGTYQIMMPMMMRMQEHMIESIESAQKARSERPDPMCPGSVDPGGPRVPDPGFETMKQMWKIPPWYNTWATVNGSLQMLLGAAYILACIFMLSMRRGAPTIFVGVLIASLLRNTTAFGVGLASGTIMAWGSVTASAMGFLIDIVLLVVVLISDRSPYFPESATPA